MGSMNALILSMKAFVISAGVISLAVGIKIYVPVAVNGIPVIWSIVLSWLKPPYLYLIINGIIITIAASSRFHQNHSQPSVLSEHFISVKTSLPTDFCSVTSTVVEDSTAVAAAVVCEVEDKIMELIPVMENGSIVDPETEEKKVMISTTVVEAQDEFADSKTTYSTESQEIISPEFQLDFISPMSEKPLVSSRFGHRIRKSIKSNPEGAKALRVARPKRQETVESTWKMITEGRHVPLTRHHKKSVDPTSITNPESNLKDRSNYDPASYRIRKEPSLSQDELNRRVEAFIKKFNEDMRLERQESMKRYMDMINRGAN